MKIEYIWFSQYKKLENIEINFGGKYKFNLLNHNSDQSEYIVSIKEDTLFIEGFYSKGIEEKGIISPSIIVGKNGAGKTTIIELIVELLNEGEYRNEIFQEGLIEFIIIYSVENNYFIEASTSKEIEFDYKDIKEFTIKRKYIEDNEYKTIFFSNVFDLKSMKLGENNKSAFYYDISNNYELGKENVVDKFINIRLHKQLLFLYKYKKFIVDNNLFKYPESLTLEVSTVHYKELEGIIEQAWIPFGNISVELFNFNKQYPEIELILSNLTKSFLIKLYKFIKLYTLPKYYMTEESIIELINEIYFYATKMDDFFTDMVKNIYIKLKQENAFDLGNIKFIQEQLKNISRSYSKYLKSVKSITGFDYGHVEVEELIIEAEEIRNEYFYRSNKKLRINLQLDNDSISKFLEVHIDSDFGTDILNVFVDKLSSGEYAIINFFSTFSSLFEQIKLDEQKSNLVIIIDEGDLYLHPQWQKEWVDNLFNFMNYSSRCNVQLIITSHSPLVLSDFIKPNVIFLKNKDDVELKEFNTFGANITEILANSFFIQDGLIGKFAKEKINSFTEKLINVGFEEFRERKEEYKKFIDSIGEILVRTQLNKLYYNKVLYLEESLDKKEQIKYLEERLAKLKGEI